MGTNRQPRSVTPTVSKLTCQKSILGREKEEQSDTPIGLGVYISKNPKSYERPRPVEEVEEVVVDQEARHTLRVGANLNPEIIEELRHTLKEFKDIFAYSASDMQGLDPTFASYELNIKEGFRPIKQKLRHQGPERKGSVIDYFPEPTTRLEITYTHPSGGYCSSYRLGIDFFQSPIGPSPCLLHQDGPWCSKSPTHPSQGYSPNDF